MAKYNAPEQSKFMQFFDIAFVVVAIFLALWLPLKAGWTGVERNIEKIDNPTWEALKQTPVQIEQWKKVLAANGVADGDMLQKAHNIIQNKFDYSIDWLQLVIMGVILIGYFVFLFMASDKEYREVIDEKFNGK
jgi:predicted PurR-regulated permease PerM